ncbi:CYTH domain-containing protein [Alishewanella tabrizica]|uniref:CYTH domain-containing protein n=1 Tax=Alishewanella tabrizica TaxID=671278 RepID=A0ABQ2WL31_9ALTE|nr:CYTH domain-containing protein [Alishewanella tabrizica]GGW56251.1 hypothetical protein GCM10008111_10530 [Alishewanella tabrizica]
MSLELELKYLIGAADVTQLAELLQVYATPTGQASHTLLNAYFDTADKWFRQHDMGLRTRQKQGRFEQTIKLSGQQHGALQIRPEYNVPCNDEVPQLAAFPKEIWPKDTDVTALQQQLIELFRTDFTRQRWLLTLPDAVLEVVYDHGEVRAGVRRQAISEIEIELIEGEAEQVFNLAEFLLKALPMRTGWLSKAARGYQLFQNITTPRPEPLGESGELLQHVRYLQQIETCFLQEGAPELLLLAEQALQQLARILQDDGQQLLASEARSLARKLAEEGGLVFNNTVYHQLLLMLSKLLLKSV